MNVFIVLIPIKREIQSALSETDTFGTGKKCPCKRDVCIIEIQVKGVKKGRDQLHGSILQRCPCHKGVH